MIDIRNTQSSISWGVPLLDQKLHISGPTLAMIVARSGYGKTSLATHVIRQNLKRGAKILKFSCEEPGEEYITRLEPGLFDILTQEQMNCGFRLADESKIWINSVENEVNILREELDWHPDLVVIDQLNKIVPGDKYAKFTSKHEKIVAIAESLQDLTKKIGIPLFILHQANRSSEGRPGFMGQADISDADAVFNEAKLVLFLESVEFTNWLKTKNPSDQTTFEYFINIAKNRSPGGWIGSVPVNFDRSTGIFFDESRRFEYACAKRKFLETGKGQIYPGARTIANGDNQMVQGDDYINEIGNKQGDLQ